MTHLHSLQLFFPLLIFDLQPTLHLSGASVEPPSFCERKLNGRALRHPQLYSHFLEEVRGDLSGASRLAKEAEKAEDLAGKAAAETEDVEMQHGMKQRELPSVNEERDAVVVISPEGSMTFVNDYTCTLFG